MTRGILKDMTRVYMDESGFSGTNLLDPNQPAYTVAAVILTEQEAEALKQHYFHRFQGPELKFSRLKRTPRHLTASIDLLEDLLNRRAIKVSAADKPFVVVAKMFDLVTEPMLYNLGYDAYQDGFISDLASDVYRLLNQQAPDTLTVALQAFAQLCAEPTETYRAQYIASLEAFPANLHELLDTVLIKPAQVMDLEFLKTDVLEGPMGIVMTTGLMAVINASREVPDRPLHVVYDRSKVMQQGLPQWNWYLSPDMPPMQIPMLDGPVDLPIAAVTKLELSEMHAGLQLADVMSGLISMVVAAIWTNQPLGNELRRVQALLMDERHDGSGHFHAVAAAAERQVAGNYGCYLHQLTETMAADPNFPRITR